jgi:hypothetical protein
MPRTHLIDESTSRFRGCLARGAKPTHTGGYVLCRARSYRMLLVTPLPFEVLAIWGVGHSQRAIANLQARGATISSILDSRPTSVRLTSNALPDNTIDRGCTRILWRALRIQTRIDPGVEFA